MKWLLGLAVLTLVGCSSVHDFGNGRYGVTRTSEVRSPFGTNVVWTKLEDCKGHEVAGGNGVKTFVYSDCITVKDWSMGTSQGQGGQVAGGFLTGAGAAVGGALVDTGASVGQTVIQTVGQAGKGK